MLNDLRPCASETRNLGGTPRSAHRSRAAVGLCHGSRELCSDTEVALKLASALDCRVEDLFRLREAASQPASRTESASLLPGSEELRPGQPVQLCRVGQQLVATSPPPGSCFFGPSDATVVRPSAKSRLTSVSLKRSRSRIGQACARGGVRPRHLNPGPERPIGWSRTILAHRNSSQALQLLKKGSIHIAGTHLRDEATGASDVPAIAALFPRDSVAVFSFAVWEEGIVAATGNPKGVPGSGRSCEKRCLDRQP